jgi:WD40-like Beta Propeller Repeat
MRVGRWEPAAALRRYLPWLLAALLALGLAILIVLRQDAVRDSRELRQELRESRVSELKRRHEHRAEVDSGRSKLRSAHEEIQRLKLVLGAPRRAALRDKRFELAFIRGKYREGGSKVVLAAPDGRVERVLIRGRFSYANWTRGGTALYVGGGLELQANGLLRRTQDRLGRFPCPSSPGAASDGTRLMCSEDNDKVYVDRGGKGRYRLLLEPIVTDDVEEYWRTDPALSPDGRLVAYVEIDRAATYRPQMTATPGTKARSGSWRFNDAAWQRFQLWETQGFSWSPDGKRIAFWAQGPDTAHVFAINANGSSLRILVRNARRPAWSPDSKEIAFDSARSGRTQVYIANADGTNVRQLTRAREGSWAPRWRRVP